MNTFKETLFLLNPLNWLRIYRRGAALCAQIRAEQGRAPTEEEYRFVTWRVEQELRKNH